MPPLPGTLRAGMELLSMQAPCDDELATCYTLERRYRLSPEVDPAILLIDHNLAREYSTPLSDSV